MTSLNSRTTVPKEELLDCRIFSYNKCQRQVDHVVICGGLTLERVLPVPFQYNKMLCMRIQSLVTKSVEDSSIVKLHNILLPLSAHNGYEVTRTGGTQDFACDQSQ